MKSTHWLYVILIAGVVAWLFLGQRSDVEAQIHARLDEMEKILIKEAGEKKLESADRARQFGKMLAEGFVLHLEPINQEIRDVAALTRPFVGLRVQVEELKVDFSNIEVEVGPDERSATSFMAVSLHATGVQNRRGNYEVSIRWRRDGGWLIEELRVVEVQSLL